MITLLKTWFDVEYTRKNGRNVPRRNEATKTPLPRQVTWERYKWVAVTLEECLTTYKRALCFQALVSEWKGDKVGDEVDVPVNTIVLSPIAVFAITTVLTPIVLRYFNRGNTKGNDSGVVEASRETRYERQIIPSTIRAINALLWIMQDTSWGETRELNVPGRAKSPQVSMASHY
ncbi:uncharacterized protein CLUP02_05356 [Colletotrichum lupini]|uniref:Uncharacterized protein n=1 Tax=Colletotrichum lupini TaxID=145971 RepID=A0A9Q8SMF7_9PEZI|nr:uncharacterized protein CLUP02_05356 [Colletotrichum lupini]UQC79875.1 hypothetical protein CLUP02_05356 [Colletotrichum lupini]